MKKYIINQKLSNVVKKFRLQINYILMMERNRTNAKKNIKFHYNYNSINSYWMCFKFWQ